MNIAIIGYGNLGRSLAQGLLKSGVPAGDICVCDASDAARQNAQDTYKLGVTDDINAAAGFADVIFLVIKSYVFDELAPTIDRDLLDGKTVVSFMAGVQIESIAERLGDGVTIVRGMPSLAIAVCDGVVAYTKAPDAVAALLQGLGYAFEAAPEDIEKVMAFSSCGLGFAAYLIDAFAEAGAKLGFSADVCEQIAAQTFRNAIDRGDWSNTVKAVATKGGATEQGILHMDASDVYGIVAGAVQKAYDRMK